MARLVFAIALFLGMSGTSFAQDLRKVVSSAPDEIGLTIYTDDLALITERRIVKLEPGRSTIAFEGVSEMIVPQSAVLREFTGVTLERNFDFDLLSPGALFEGSEGDTVTIFRTNPATGKIVAKEARIVAGGNGVVLEIDGKFEALQCAGLPEKTAFEAVPDRLKPKPTLSIDVTAEAAGEQEIVLSYLASGFGWQADYRLDLNDDGATGVLLGWLTVYNQTEISVENAETVIIAGDLQRLPETYGEQANAKSFSARCWPRGSSKTGIPYIPPSVPLKDARPDRMVLASPAPMMMESEMMADEIMVTASRVAKQEEIGDYKLYRVPNPTTVAAYQEKQIMFLEAAEVDLEKIFTFNLYEADDYDGDLRRAEIVYHLDNSREGRLAKPLPKGIIRVMTKDVTGMPFYLGEDTVDNLAVDLPADFEIDYSADIQMMTRLVDYSNKELADGRRESVKETEHYFYNASPTPVTIELKIGESYYGVVKIRKSNLPYDSTEDAPTWKITIPAESQRTLKIETTYIGN